MAASRAKKEIALPYKSKHEMQHLQISGECIANAPRWEMEDRIQITYLCDFQAKTTLADIFWVVAKTPLWRSMDFFLSYEKRG